MGRATTAILAGAMLLLCSQMALSQGSSRRRVDQEPGSAASRYYIITKATLIGPPDVFLFGASNLPAGAVLTVYIYDHIGEGGNNLSDEVRVTVGKDGLFTASIHPRKGLTFRPGMICSVVFEPNYPPQPRTVLKIVGTHGRRLGSYDTDPEVGNFPSGTTLGDITVVTP